MSPITLLGIARIALLSAALTCCAATSPTPRTVDLGTSATLAPNESVRVNTTSLEIRFLSITSDSRCPKSTTCVWAGQVTAQFAVSSDGTTTQHEITAQETATIGDRVLTFESVQPERLTEAKIPAGDYRATIKVD